MKPRRILQIFFGCLFGLVSATFMMGAIGRVMHGAPATALLVALFPLLIGLIPIGAIELQIRSLNKTGKAVRAAMEAVAKAVFDAPAELRRGYDLSAVGITMPMPDLLQANDENAWTADGTCGDVRVSAASHTSVAGRQIGELHHVYSHVVVDVLGLVKPFKIQKQGLITRLGLVSDTEVGDAAFDAMFRIEGDSELMKAVLDDGIKKRIAELQAQVGSVSQDGPFGGMFITLSKQGLALRWPGELNAAFATYVRDLLLEMREKILAYENRAAAKVRVGEQTGYRIAATPEEPAEEEAVEGDVDGKGRTQSV